MTQLHESDIEQMLIEQLKAKGYQYLYGPDIAADENATPRCVNTVTRPTCNCWLRRPC